MGFLKMDTSGQYWNLRHGKLTNKDGREEEAYRGRIMGIRLRDSVYKNKPLQALQMKMKGDDGETVIISMTSFNEPQSAIPNPSVAFRMLLQRLIPHKGQRELAKDEMITISVWQYESEVAAHNCVAIYDSDMTKVVANPAFDRDVMVDDKGKYTREAYERMLKAVERLEAKYGTWSSGEAVLSTYSGENDDVPLPSEDYAPVEEDSFSSTQEDLPF